MEYAEFIDRVFQMDWIEGLKTLPDKSVHCIVTSPPYYGLRNYGVLGQLGLEKTPEEYVQKMVTGFDEAKRVLRDDGTLWCNLGDSYASGKGKCNNPGGNTSSYNVHLKAANVHPLDRGNKSTLEKQGLKPKDLIGIPWMVAFALRSAGWYLRQDIIWHKNNPMPESVTDRCTKSHEYIFLLSKSAKYYFNAYAIATPYQDKTLTTFGCEVKGNGDGSGLIQSENWAKDIEVRKPKVWKNPDGWDTAKGAHGTIHRNGREKGRKGYAHRGAGGGDKKFATASGNRDAEGNIIGGGLANKRSVWTVPTMPYPEAHFATFPEDLIVDCIKAGCPEFVCNKCGKAREKIIQSIAGYSAECPKTQQSHEARGGTGKPTGTVGKSGGGRTEPVSMYLGLTDCGHNAGFSPGIVLDPFMGAFTTALVAKKLNRHFVGFELNPDYIKIGEKRLRKELGLFHHDILTEKAV